VIRLSILGLCFVSGNFVYEYISTYPSYEVAIERAYFQVIAMLFIVIVDKLFVKTKQENEVGK